MVKYFKIKTKKVSTKNSPEKNPSCIGLQNICIIFQKSAIEKYNIGKVNFDQIFTGNPPEFPSSKKLSKNSMSPPSTSRLPHTPGSGSRSAKKLSPDKKGRQESMDKFVKKTDG